MPRTLSLRPAWRAPLLLALGLLGLLTARAVGGCDPQGEIRALAEAVAAARGERGPYRTEHAYLGYISPDAWTLTIHVGRVPRLAPTRFLIIERVRDRLAIELMHGPGVQGTTMLAQEAAWAYLRQADLDITPLEAVR
ncbi:MAG: hypothetical protein M9894_20530 [Planctomycetes bacterium]|nr:hypothetical protein [Planctomycetota bacterium]